MTKVGPCGASLQLALRSATGSLRERVVHDERGEGVISAGIAVLIMALIGAAMWVAFKAIFDDAATATQDAVNRIGD